jgi:hypothetical protein
MLYANTQSQAAVSALESQGIKVPAKPLYDIPSLPADITDLGDEALMVLYSKLTAYADFIAVQVSCSQVDERSYEKRLSILEQTKMLRGTGKSENRVTFARAEVATDPDVLALKESVEELHAYRKLIEAMANNIERDTALVSRELTRRTSNTTRRRTF